MPSQRQAFVPQPVVDRSPMQLRAYVEGNDPISKRPFMQEVIEALSKPLNDDDFKNTSYDRTAPRLLSPDTEANLHGIFSENRWTDFFPIVLPTEERVAQMLSSTSHAPDEIVGRLRPAFFREYWEFNVEKVAVNAVMAGARPEYFPVILALSASGLTARSSSTNSFAVFSVINGPIREEIGMTSGIGTMGPFNHANATIGRAHNLLSQNLQGGSDPGETYLGTFGNWYNFSATFAEAEERSPWTPFHVGHGYKASDSVARAFFGGWYTQAGYGPRDTWQEKLRRAFTACEQLIAPVMILDPIAARGFEELGFGSKEKLIEWCSENARLPAREYWDDQWIKTLKHPLAVAGVEPYASRLKAAPDELVRMYEPEDINIIVTGGETQGAWKIMAGDYRSEMSVSIDEWR